MTRLFFLLVRLLLFSALSLSSLRAQTMNGQTPAAVGRWTARSIRNGLALDFDQIPLVRGGLVQVFSQDYAKGYYGSGSNPPMPIVEHLTDGGLVWVTKYDYAADAMKFSATQRMEVHPDDTVTITIRCRWDGPRPALLEWNAARIWAYPLIGATYRALHVPSLQLSPSITGSAPAEQTASSHETTGTVGPLARATKYPQNSLAPAWQSISLLNTAFGEVGIQVGAGEPAEGVLFDGREDEYIKDEKLFWLGLLGTELTPGQEIVRSFTLKLKPRRAAAMAVLPESKSQLLNAKTVRIPDAGRPLSPLRDEAGHPIMIPEPKEAKFQDASEDFVLDGSLTLHDTLPNGIEFEPARQEMVRLAADINRASGIRVTVEAGAAPRRSVEISIEAADLSKALPAEGYRLSVTAKDVKIIGQDAAGAFYGLQTLRQLLTRRADKRFVFIAAFISDWPSMSFRGVHIYAGKNALPFHQRLVERVLAPYKLNRLVLECEYTRWHSHPEVALDYSMSTEDLRSDVAFARAHLLEPIPLVNTLGHSEWIFANSSHLDLAEDVRSPHAYDASNPDSYKFVFDVFTEALDIFRPRFFHIGHDEVKVPSQDRAFGKYPARPANIVKGASALFTEDTNRLADWLRAKGVRTLLWSDMLLHDTEGPTLPGVPMMTAANAPTVGEARLRRAAMPKDAIIVDWRYTPGDEQRNGLDFFRERGQDTLAAPWFQPENIRGWANQAITHRSLGMVTTTWAGNDSNESLLEWWPEYRQFTAYVFAAEYSWSGSEKHPADIFGRPFYRGYETPIPESSRDSYSITARQKPNNLPYDAMTVFNRAYRETQRNARLQTGWYLSLLDAANIRLSENWPASLPIAAYTPTLNVHSADARDWPIDERESPQIADVGVRTAGIRPAGIMLYGLLNRERPQEIRMDERAVAYPKIATLPVHARASWLFFLHATAFAAEDKAHVATYLLHYADGQTAEIPLRYGKEIRALDDDTSAATLSTDPVHSDSGAVPLNLRLLRWKNPHPAVEIITIEFRTDHPYAAPILFGVTGR